MPAEDTAAERARVERNQDAGFGHANAFERQGPIPGTTLNPQGDVHRQLTRAVKHLSFLGCGRHYIAGVLDTTIASIDIMLAQPDN